MYKSIDGFSGVPSSGEAVGGTAQGDQWEALTRIGKNGEGAQEVAQEVVETEEAEKKNSLTDIVAEIEGNEIISDGFKEYARDILKIFEDYRRENSEDIRGVEEADVVKVETSVGDNKNTTGDKSKQFRRRGKGVLDGVVRSVVNTAGEQPAEGLPPIQEAVVESAEEVKEEPTKVLEKVEDKTENKAEDNEEGAKYGLIPFTKGTPEANEIREDDAFITFSTQSDAGYAVKRDEAVNAFREMVKNVEPGKEFFEAQHLGSAILEAKPGKFSESEIGEVVAIKNSPLYQAKEFRMHIEDAKKNAKRALEDAESCKLEVEKAKKGGLFSRGALKAARLQEESAKIRFKEAGDTIRFYEKKLEAMPDWAKGEAKVEAATVEQNVGEVKQVA